MKFNNNKKYNPISFKKVSTESNISDLIYAVAAVNLIVDPDDNKKWTIDDIKHVLKNGSDIFLILQGENVIGSISIKIYNDDTVDLFNFAIFPQYQGKGLGRKAITNIIKYIQNKHPDKNKIYLVVFKINKKAINLYKTLNFKIAEDRGSSYLMIKSI